MHFTGGPDPDTLFSVTVLVYLFAALASFGAWFRDRRSIALLSWAAALAMMGCSNFLLFKSGDGLACP